MQAVGEMMPVKGAICYRFWYLSEMRKEAEPFPGWVYELNKMRSYAKYKTRYLQSFFPLRSSEIFKS